MTPADLQATLAARFGLTGRPTAAAQLALAAEALAQKLGLPLTRLMGQLDLDPELARTLVGHLTVDETYFLRQPAHFELILERIKSRAQTPTGRPFTIWSAGCAHGEEPYTIAILLAEQAPWVRPLVRILASDLSHESLRQARDGCYSDWSLRDVPDWFRARYFQRTQNGWQLEPSVRAAVRFEHLSVLEHIERLPWRSVDLLLFRNVAIYLEPQTLARVYEGFSRVLAEDGLLVLGPSDPPPARELFSLGTESCGSVYHHPAAAPEKPAANARAPVARPRAAPPAARLIKERPVPAAPRSTPAATSRREPSAHARSLHDQATRLGNQGDGKRALELAGQVIDVAPGWSAGYVLRATLLLASSHHREALADLRHAAYLAPEELLPRFLCASALRASRLNEQARAEARELIARLRRLPAAALLEDGRTSAAELLGAALELSEEKG